MIMVARPRCSNNTARRVAHLHFVWSCYQIRPGSFDDWGGGGGGAGGGNNYNEVPRSNVKNDHFYLPQCEC